MVLKWNFKSSLNLQKYKWNIEIVHGTMRKEKFEVDGGKCMSDLYVSDLDGTLLRISRDVKDF